MAGGFDYWALGHIHAPEVVQEANPTIVYSGSTQGLDVNEVGPRGCYHVVVDEAGGVSPRFVETDAVRWFSEAVEASEITDDQALLDTLKERLEQLRQRASGRTALVRLRLTGRTPLHRQLRAKDEREALMDELRGAEDAAGPCVWVESLASETRAPLDLEGRRDGQDLLADFLRAAEEARSNPQALAAVREALQKLLDRREIRELWTPSDTELRQLVDEAVALGADLLLPEEG